MNCTGFYEKKIIEHFSFYVLNKLEKIKQKLSFKSQIETLFSLF